MIIINDVTIFVEIPLRKNAMARDEQDELIHEEDQQVMRGIERLDEIIMGQEIWGYVTIDDAEDGAMFIFLNGLLQDTLVKEVLDICKSFVTISSKPFVIETFVENEYKYNVLFDEEVSTMDEAKILDDLLQIKDHAMPHVYKLAELPIKFGPELKKLMTAIEKFFDQPAVTKILPSMDIMDAIEQMQRETHNG